MDFYRSMRKHEISAIGSATHDVDFKLKHRSISMREGTWNKCDRQCHTHDDMKISLEGGGLKEKKNGQPLQYLNQHTKNLNSDF
jgi:hypothetical protein